MSPEKVAILVVAGLIAVLLAVALLGTESTGSGATGTPEKPKAPATERVKPAPKQIEEYTYQDIVRGNTRPVRLAEPKPSVEPVAAKTTQYVVKRNDTLEKIARRELGNPGYVGRILALNKGVNPSKLAVGTKLELPVVKADTKAVAEATPPRAKAPASSRGKKEVAAAGKSL
jgi:nucleoid-associated protein YgaU